MGARMTTGDHSGPPHDHPTPLRDLLSDLHDHPNDLPSDLCDHPNDLPGSSDHRSDLLSDHRSDLP